MLYIFDAWFSKNSKIYFMLYAGNIINAILDNIYKFKFTI